MKKAGTIYRPSVYFDKRRLALSIPLVFFVCIPLGYLFYQLIYLLGFDLKESSYYFKVVLSLICLGLSYFFLRKMIKSRSRALEVAVVLLISLTTWYSLWASVLSDFEGVGYWGAFLHPSRVLILYVQLLNSGYGLFSDTVAFFISILLIFGQQKDIIYDYFCEDCSGYYSSKEFFINEGRVFERNYSFSAPGYYHFLKELPLLNDGEKCSVLDKDDLSAYRLKFNWCGSCRQNSILDIYKHDKFLHESMGLAKNTVKTILSVESEIVVEGIYIDQDTHLIFYDISKKARDKHTDDGGKNMKP